MEQVVDVPVRQRPHAPRAVVSWRAVEQVVDVPAQLRVLSSFAAVSGRNVEQVVDFPGLRVDARSGARSAAGSRHSRSAAASLEAPQERIQVFFRTFPGEKVRRLGASRVRPLGAHSSPCPEPAYGTDDHQFWTSPDNRVWKRIYDPHYDRFYWNIVGTAHVQWEPPWQGWGSSDSDV